MKKRGRRPAVGACLVLAATLTFGQSGAAAQEPLPGPSSGSLIDVPFLPQSELLCGGAAAAMVLRYWGATGVTSEDFRPLVRPDEGGIRGGELASEVRRRGWQAIAFRGTESEFRRHLARGRPVVALLEVGPDRYHYVVVVAWTDAGVLFHDPARAPFLALPTEEFEAAWTATDRWALLVLPSGAPPDRGEAPSTNEPPSTDAPPDRPVDRADDRADDRVEDRAQDRAGDGDPRDTSDVERAEADGRERDRPDVCEGAIHEAVTLAGSGEEARAEVLLRETMARCPGSGRARAELAGLHARRGAWPRVRELAEVAVELSPTDPFSWRLLATSRFLTGDRPGALMAWNRLGEPRIERIRLEGLGRTRYQEAQRRLGLSPDQLLTPEAWIRSSRRLDLLPSARSTRVDYRPLDDGRAEVTGHLLQRPLFPDTPGAWTGILVRGAVSRRVMLHLSSPTGAGELWTAGGRWEENRPALSVGVAVPGFPFLPGTVSVEGGWERQSYRVAADGGAGFGTGGGAGSDAATDLRVEERRTAGLRMSDWMSGRARWILGAGLHRWKEGPTDATLEGGFELRSLSDRVSVLFEGILGGAVAGSPRRGWAAGGVAAKWRSSADLQGPVAHARAAVRGATGDAPLAVWPGAGEGRARDGLLRAHPLLDDGIVSGDAFGRVLAHGGVEGRWWIRPLPGIPVAAATFFDVARPWHPLSGEKRRLLVDAGAGLRASLPGQGGVLRADLARPVDGGGWRFQVGWNGPWPLSGAPD